MNLFASTQEKEEEEEDDEFLFMFEQDDNNSQCLDMDLQRLNEETTQMGLLVNSIEARTKDDLLRWQKVVEDCRLPGKSNFLQRLSQIMTPGSGSSPLAGSPFDEREVSAQLRRSLQKDLQKTHSECKQKKNRSWRTWIKGWLYSKKGDPMLTDSDSEGLLVMNSVDVEMQRSPPHRVQSTVQARNFFDAERLPSSSVTLAEHKYFFGGNMAAAQVPEAMHGSSESIISETTPGLQLARRMKYSVLTHDAPCPSSLVASMNDGIPRSSSEIRTPPLLQTKKSKSSSNILSFRGRSLRKRRINGHYMH
ncbi:uncharacterized protein ZBIST_3714 [Zygosaccharomyces bailii]|nr:uncharacterized protein ZBIST_3714 [Zygosaccharomyces bailii]